MTLQSSQQPVLNIDIYSDVVCPWCYIGIKRFEAGAELARSAGDQTQLNITWRAFQLDPTVPEDGYEHHAHLAAKFGGEQAMQAKFDHVKEVGRSVGIAFAFDKIKVSPNTLQAHRLIRLAGEMSPNLQNTVTKRLFRAYFEEAQNIGDIDVLTELASECGIERDVIDTMFNSERLVAETQFEVQSAARMGISGVPCFIFERRYAVSGAQAAETFADAISQIVAAKVNGMLESAA
jgi:predicted DsbA family dithiol-disulfide isomerase